MEIFEFELRYLAYKGLENRYDIHIGEENIINLVKKTNRGKLEKKLVDSTPKEIEELTYETYTNFKKNFIKERGEEKIKYFTLKDYIDRLEYELKVIQEMGYDTYFIIVQDYINRARKNNISVGPGRGSGAGSLLSYLIKITDIDPLDYDLIFERFLNPARISMPDIDTDFEDTKRDQLLDYVKQKYGTEKVASIGTYMTMAAKAAFKDVARVFGLPFEQANRISNYITEKTIAKSLEENEDLQNVVESDSKIKKIIELSQQLEGTVRQVGVHACGVIISPEEATKYTPIQYPPLPGGKKEKDESRVITQYDGHFLEDIGLLKMDFLGLRNLTIIKNTIKIIKARCEKEGKELDPLLKNYFEHMGFYPPLDDQYTYETTFQVGDTSGIFQFESDGMRGWLKKLKPTGINDLIAMVSLYRPGPMEFIPNYVARKHGEENIRYITEELYQEIKEKYGEEVAKQQEQKLTDDLSKFMDVTFGIPVYQEQLMRIAQSVAGFSLGEADVLRRGVGKKIKEVIDKLKPKFIDSAINMGYKEEMAVYVYEKMIEPAANYSFNKSHATCYANIAYQTAYLKAHYYIEFHASLLRSIEEDTEKLAKLIDELKMQGLNITKPSINQSYTHVGAIENDINIGFLAIKGVGYEIAKTIVKERKQNGKFQNLEDFLKRCKSAGNRKTLEALIKAGTLDEFEDRNTLLKNIDIILNWIRNQTESSGGGLFDTGSLNTALELKDQTTTSISDKITMEEDVFKTFLSNDLFDGLYYYIKKKYNFISMFKEVEDYGDFSIIGYIKDFKRIRKKGVFVKIEDISGEIEIFLKDSLDLKKYDLIILEGYKGKSIKTKRIVRTKLEDIINKAKSANLYYEDSKIVDIRASRKNSSKENILSDEAKQNKDDNKERNNKSNKQDTKKEKNNNENVFDIPEDIEILNQVSNIIKSNEGDIEIYLGSKKFYISKEGLKNIKNILKS